MEELTILFVPSYRNGGTVQGKQSASSVCIILMLYVISWLEYLAVLWMLRRCLLSENFPTHSSGFEHGEKKDVQNIRKTHFTYIGDITH